MTGVTFLGWVDPDRKKPAHLKLGDAMQRHLEKFGVLPNVCLTSEADAVELNGRGADLGVQIEGRGYISRGVFYVGHMGTAAHEARQGVLL